MNFTKFLDKKLVSSTFEICGNGQYNVIDSWSAVLRNNEDNSFFVTIGPRFHKMYFIFHDVFSSEWLTS